MQLHRSNLMRQGASSTGMTSRRPQKLIIYLEGNIVAGKSACIEALETRYADPVGDVGFIDEPLEAWTEGDINLLQAMYEGSLSHPTFQLLALCCRAGRTTTALQGSDIVIAERSLWSDRHVFANTVIKDPIALKAYEVAHSHLKDSMPLDLAESHIILELPPEVALARIRRRARPEESHITIQNRQ